MRLFQAIVLFSGLCLCGFGQPALGDTFELPDFRAGPAQMPAIRALTMPPLSAQAALLVDFPAGQALWEARADMPWPPASTTKLMTALLTLEAGNLDATVTVSPAAAARAGTRMGLMAGQQFSARQLLYGLLLPSGNDAAITLAEHQAGSVAAFVQRMNARAKELDLSATRWTDPDGIDDANDISTAEDLAKLARTALMIQPSLNQYVATAHLQLAAEAGHSAFDLNNLNRLLITYPGADGVKTGTTSGAQQNLVGSATRDGHRLLVVVLGSVDRYADARQVLDYGFGNFTWFKADQTAAGALLVRLHGSVETVLPSWQARQIHGYFDPDTAVATFMLLGRMIVTVPFEPAA